MTDDEQLIARWEATGKNAYDGWTADEWSRLLALARRGAESNQRRNQGATVMSNNYDAVYTAAYQAFRGDYSWAFENACREGLDFSWQKERIVQAFNETLEEWQRPSVLYRPTLTIDGNQWCALYGLNLQDGVAGFGDSPAHACRNFDAAWLKKLEQQP
jgi:hypothetical protein